jgi:hypothetical protein
MDISRRILKRITGILKHITGIFKIEPIRKIATEVSRSLLKKNKKNVFTAWFVTDHAHRAVKCGHGLEKRQLKYIQLNTRN